MLNENNAFIEKQAAALTIRIVGSGYVYADRAWCGKGICSPFSRFFFVTDGEAEFTVAGERTALTPGYVYLLPIGVRHDYACADRMEKLWFHVNMELYDGADLFSGLDRCYRMPFDARRVEEVKAGYLSGTMSGVLAVEGLICETAAAFAEMTGVNSRPVREYSPLLKALFPVVRANVSSKMTVRSLAEQLAVSESTLTKRFRSETGRTLGGYLDDMLMHRARQLLMGEKSIGEIADQLDFCDQFYFSRYFRQRQGDTPSRYRRLMKAQL